MINCGFRNIDVDSLKQSVIDWKQGRIIIQRHKLRNVHTAPVINYKLWQITIDHLEKYKNKNNEFIFYNKFGNRYCTEKIVDGETIVNDQISNWWRRNRKQHGLQGKRLNMLRVTGATICERFDRGINEIYLGESLSTTAKIHYSFNDGEICIQLDQAIQYLGGEMGLEKVEESPMDKLMKRAKEKGITVKALIAQL